MEQVLEAKKERLQKLDEPLRKLENSYYHGWITQDKWIEHKKYISIDTNTYTEVSYITKEYYNPLPFHNNIEYVGLVVAC